jgi:hypothetical protein
MVDRGDKGPFTRIGTLSDASYVAISYVGLAFEYVWTYLWTLCGVSTYLGKIILEM